jgi:hypothetical protein
LIHAGNHVEALQELEICQKRRSEAMALFLDDVPSVRYLATLPYWLARAQQAAGQKERAIDNYQAYLTLRSAAPGDPLAIDARKRIAAG